MMITILTTLIVLSLFLAAVSLLYAYATDLGLSADSVLLGSFVLAGIFILIQFAISPWIVRISTGLVYLKPGENVWLETTVQNLATQARVPMPKLARVPSPVPNAFVFGNSTSNMTLAVHDGLLQKLNEDEVTGVLAHEVGHIKHRDSIIMTVLSALPLIAYIIARTSLNLRVYGASTSRRGGKNGNGASLIFVAGIIALIVYFVAQLLVLSLSRKREHFADAFSAYITQQPRSLQSALTKITYGLSLAPD
jgi:heat shock protein HtpX